MTLNESEMHNMTHQAPSEDGPLVSIGVPVYNGAKFLKECLDSILHQTYQNWECVILDNNSSDETNSIARGFVNKDDRFKLFRNDELLPHMDNWNQVYKLTDKEAVYFKIIPADDWIFPEFLEEMVALMESNPGVGVASSYRLDGIRVRGKGIDYYNGPVIDGKWVIDNELFACIDVTGSANTVLYRNSLLKIMRDYPSIFNPRSLHGDTELTYDLLYRNDFGFAFKVLSFTRRHDESITNKIAKKVNSSICFRDNQMVKYEDIIEDFNRKYKSHRVHYSLRMLKYFFRFNGKALRWQNNNLANKFTAGEIVKALIVYLPFYKYRKPCS